MNFGTILKKYNFEEINYKKALGNYGTPSTIYKHKSKNIIVSEMNWYALAINYVKVNDVHLDGFNFRTDACGVINNEQQKVFDAFENKIKELLLEVE